MMIKKKPYLILVFVAILFIALYFFTNFDLNFTINIHDTYFVMSRELVFLFFIVLFGFTSILYFVLDFLKINFSLKSIWFHSIVLLSITTIIFYLSYLSNEFNKKEKVFEGYLNSIDYNKYIFMLVLMLFSFQLYFIINIISQLIRKIINTVKN